MTTLWIDDQCTMKNFPDISKILIDDGITARNILINNYEHLFDTIRKCYIIIKVAPNNKGVTNGDVDGVIKESYNEANIIKSVIKSHDKHLMVSKVFELESTYKFRFKDCPHCIQKFIDQKEIFKQCMPIYTK
jgi:hypothetical protein